MVFDALRAVGLGAAGLLLLRPTDACSCFSVGHLCDYIQPADVVLRATALSRDEDKDDMNADAVYVIRTVEVYKSLSDQDYYAEDMEINITTPGNSGLCGIYMEIGEDYLIDLNLVDGGSSSGSSSGGSGSTAGGSQFKAIGMCGLFRSWSDVEDSEDDLAILEEGCDDYDACDGECSESQDCMIHFSGDVYYCEDSCDLGACEDDEECTLSFDPSCTLTSSNPCPRQAICTTQEATNTPAPVSGTVPLPTPPPRVPTDPATRAPVILIDRAMTPPPGASMESSSSSATGAPNLGFDIALTPPPGAFMESSSSGTGPPSVALSGDESSSSATGAPTLGRDVAMTLPPGASVESSSSGTRAPSAGRVIATTLPPGASEESSSSSATGAPNLGYDIALTPPPGASMESSSSSATGAPNLGHDSATTLPPGASTESSSSSVKDGSGASTDADESPAGSSTHSPSQTPTVTPSGFDGERGGIEFSSSAPSSSVAATGTASPPTLTGDAGSSTDAPTSSPTGDSGASAESSSASGRFRAGLGGSGGDGGGGAGWSVAVAVAVGALGVADYRRPF